MPSYVYQAIDRKEVGRSGTVEAASLAEAATAVAALDLEVVRIEAADVAIDGGSGLARRPRAEPPGPMPAAPPRPLPPGVTGAPGGGFLLIFGSIFAGVASIFIVVGLIIAFTTGDNGGLIMAGVPLIHFTIGVGAISYSLHHRQRRRDLAVNGVATVATVAEVGHEPMVKVNGKNPFTLEYTFEANGQSYGGKRRSMNRAMTAHVPDDSIWVVYDREDPSRNMEWPPL